MTKKQPFPPAPAPEQQLLTLLQALSLAVAKAETVNSAYAEVVAHICRFMDWPLGHVYIWSQAANALVSSGIWFMADASTIAPFRELSEATQFQRGEGTLGQVWQSGQALSILDVRHETAFVRQMPVAEGGIRAYFAFPVMVVKEVTAVLEFFSPQSVAPDQDMTSIINHVSTLLGLAMQRQQSRQRLQASEAQLAEAQRIAHIGHWQWDVLRNEVTWSPELYRIYGLSRDSFAATYEDFLQFVHPDDLAYVQKKVEAAYENGRNFDYFHRIVRPDGKVRVLHARGRPVFDQAGAIIKLSGTAQDMTEQKEAEIQLAQTVRQLSTLMEMGQAISATVNLNEIYQQVLKLARPLLAAEALLLFLHKEEMLEIVALDQDNIPDMRGQRVPLDDGIVGEVWQTGRSLFLKGADCLKRLSPQLKEKTGYQPQAILAVPIHWQDNQVGVLEAAHRQPDAFNEADLRLLETVATWTAIAIANAHQYQQLQRRLREGDAILAVSNALTEAHNLDELLQFIVRHTQEIIANADWAVIHLYQPQTNQLELAASAGLEIDADAYRLNLEEGLAAQVMREGVVVNVADVQTNSLRLPVDVRTNARSLLIAPVESRQGRLGTLSVQCATPHTFRAGDERLLTIFGNQAGLAIEHARLYDVQRRARERAERQRERMRYMAQRVVQAQEAERARIARELHDESGQSLTALKISLDFIRSSLPPELNDVKEALADVLALTDQTLSNLRLLSHNLRPPGLDAYGLDAALAGLCQDMTTRMAFMVQYKGENLPDLIPLSALSLYRVAQEALTNAAKHAQATEVQVTLTQDSDMITLSIKDNGRGFSPPNLEEALPPHGAGLLGMVERLEMVDGQLHIDSTVGQGSCLTAVVPYIRENL